MNLVRLGHYFTPRGSGDGLVEGACQTALVCSVDEEEPRIGTEDRTVTVAVWRQDGVALTPRESIPVIPPSEGEDSFHLSADCPWKR